MKTISLACSSYTQKYFSKEQFTGDHIFSYLITGVNTIHDGIKEYTRTDGSFILLRRNRLVKVMKEPPLHGEYKSISVRFGEDFLKEFSREYDIKAETWFSGETLTALKSSVLLKNVMLSLIPYFEQNEDEIQDILILKAKELVLLLLKSNPELKNLLFDFNQPGKIDLEEFMNINFHFNVSTEKFAYLTGRSLTAFKRDFKQIFNGQSPGKWLIQKRLDTAYHLINDLQEKPSNVFLKVGFEDLSHFSYVFKKKFGIPPSTLIEK